MTNCKAAPTPIDAKNKLSNDGASTDDATAYRSPASVLQFLTMTRPDIAFAVQQACLHMHDPKVPHMTLLKRILRYICGTTSHGLHLHASTELAVMVYSDADWARCPDTRCSTSGFCVYLSESLVS
jgi:hypothetical protein